MTQLKHSIRYEDVDGDGLQATFFTQDNSTTEINIGDEGNLLVTENIGKEYEDIPEGDVPIFYVPDHRLESVETQVFSQ